MISAKKVFATFAVVLTLGGAVSSLTSVETSNVTAHAAKKHVKKVNHKTSKDTFYHVATIYNHEVGAYSAWSPIGEPTVYALNLPYNKYSKNLWHSNERPVKANYKELQKSVKMNIKKWTTLDPYIYGNQKRFRDMLYDKVVQINGYASYIGAMQKNIIPLLKNHIDKKDYDKLASIQRKSESINKSKKYKALLKHTDKYFIHGHEVLNSDKKSYKEYRSSWELNKEYLRVLSKVFGYLKY